MIGISAYAGMEQNIEEILEYIESAHKLGIKLLFTSAHIPEVGDNFHEDFKAILDLCKRLGIITIVDISKDYFEELDLDKHEIDYIRLDYGFTLEEAANLTKDSRFGISVNATTFDRTQIEKFTEYGGNVEKINACHNFYPRRDTGISTEFFLEKNKLFKEYNITTMAFIPTKYKRRGPVHEGLPTIESHRELHPLVSAQHLSKLGTDYIVIGDAMASKEELEILSSLDEETTILPIVLEENLSQEELFILENLHTNRADPGAYTIRSQESRIIKNGNIEAKNNNSPRRKYSVTLDNKNYGRYEGELQILKKDLSLDSRVNIVGSVEEASILIDLLKPNEKFKFYFL